MREILPRIGYTSLPILAVSSVENRGIIELKKELASLIVRNVINIDKNKNYDGNDNDQSASFNKVEKFFAASAKYDDNKEKIVKKAIRSWKPLETKDTSGKLLVHILYYVQLIYVGFWSR